MLEWVVKKVFVLELQRELQRELVKALGMGI